MTTLGYEQPLNEKVRSYLRLEYLKEQMDSHFVHDQKHRCFYPLFALCELTERGDYRIDIIKDIDKNVQQLTDKSGSSSLIEALLTVKEKLQTPERTGSKLKHDRFLSALKQRFNMPGACCNFDLPQLHYWLGLPWEQRVAQYRQWQRHFLPLLDSVTLLLNIIRTPSIYSPQEAKAGFYQGIHDKSLSLIRVNLESQLACYPTISGHKNRFAIHFVDFNSQKHTDNTINFQLAICE